LNRLAGQSGVVLQLIFVEGITLRLLVWQNHLANRKLDANVTEIIDEHPVARAVPS
jgi:hypothetical protein